MEQPNFSSNQKGYNASNKKEQKSEKEKEEEEEREHLFRRTDEYGGERASCGGGSMWAVR